MSFLIFSAKKKIALLASDLQCENYLDSFT